MNLLPKFKEYLFSQGKPSSKVTAKNYISDVSRFIKWFEVKFSSFSPELVTPEIIGEFKQSGSLAISSKERNLSSLRKFFNFLKLEGHVAQSPFELEAKSYKLEAEKDPYKLKDFKDYLYVYNASKLTIKNYLMDVKGFTKWAEEVTNSKSAWDIKEKDILGKIDSPLIEEYKRRLPYAPRTINRKLSSLRKYLKWATDEGLIPSERFGRQPHLLGDTHLSIAENLSSPRSLSQIRPSQPSLSSPKSAFPPSARYSKFPPFRLIQKTLKGLVFIPEFILVNPLASLTRSAEHLIWKLKGKPVFDTVKSQKSKVKSLPKEIFAPFAISTTHLPLHEKVLFHLAHTRPHWYKKYHSYSFSHYFHLAILMVFMSVIGFGIYQNLSSKSQNQAVLGFANPQVPPRILSFQGRLTDSSDNPITSSTNLRFALYDSPTGTGSALLWQEVDTVAPDSDGIFSLLLGNRSTMSQSLFAERAGLWLGVTVGQTAELTPRQRLATVAYAENADNLQGLPPITQSGAGTTNVVLALDSSGNLTIGGTATPTFQATGGKFTVSGNVLALTTTAGSKSDVQIIPASQGLIDLQRPIRNTSNNNNIATALGAVEFDDLVAILATSSGQSALTINQNGAGPILSASSSGTARFTISNAGDLTNTGAATLGDATSDDIAINGRFTTSLVPKTTANVDLGTTSLRWNNVWAQTINTTGTNTSGQATFTYDPATTAISESSVFINPTAANTDEALLGIAIAGAEKARIDFEGDLILGYNSATATLASDPFNVYNHGTTRVAAINTSGNLTLAAGQGIDTLAAGTLAVGNTTATTVNIGNTAATTIAIGAGGALTRTISIGTGTGADTINIGTGTVTADTISIGGLASTVIATTGTLTHTGTLNLNNSGSATTAIGNSTGSLTLASGGTSSWANTSGNLTIQTATSGTLVLDSAGAINIGNTNATSLSIGRTGVTTTNNGTLTSTGLITASAGVTLAANQNLTLSSGTGVYSQTNAQTTDATADAFTLSLSAGGTGSTGTLRGLVISQADTTTIGVFDSLLYLTNLKTPETTTNGILIEQNAVSGTLTNGLHITNTAGTLTDAILIDGTAPSGNILNTGSLDISGGGAISGATGITSSGTITFSGLTASRGVFTTTGGQLTTTGASADLLATLSDETGTGVAVFGTSPNITTSLTTGSTTFALVNTNATTLNIGGAATTVSLGASTGTTTVNNALTVTGNFSQSGSSTLSTGTGAVSLNGATTVTAPSSSTIPLTVKGATSQSVDLLQLKTSLDAVIAKVDQLGNITGNTLTSTVATGTAPLTVTSTTMVANLNAAAAQQPNPNLVLNSDFSRRNKWMTFMPETFADTSGLTLVIGGSIGTVSANKLTTPANVGWRATEGLSTWRDIRVSASVQATNGGGGDFRVMVAYTDENNSVFFAANPQGGSYQLTKRVGGVQTDLATGTTTFTNNNWYWVEVEKQGTTYIGKLYSSGVSPVAKSSATLVATLSGTATDSVLASGFAAIGTSMINATVFGGISTGDGGVYVEGWGPESWAVTFGGTTGGQAFGFDEAADSGPLSKQYTPIVFIPATSRTLTLTYNSYDGSMDSSQSYIHSGYVKNTGLGGSGTMLTFRVAEQNSASTDGTLTDVSDAAETSWTRKTSSSFATASTARRFSHRILINPSSTRTGTVRFDLPQLEQGSVATPWRNAPADDGRLTWYLKNVSNTSPTNATGTAAEIDSRDLAGNIFLPIDSTVELSLNVDAKNDTLNANSTFDITVDGTRQDGEIFFSESVVNNTSIVHLSRVASLSAGKHRIAARFRAVSGTVTVDFASNVNAVLKASATRGKFDLAEEYEVSDNTIGAGDVVRLSQNSKIKSQNEIERTDKGYDGAVLGIVSTAPGITLSSTVELNGYREKPNLRPVALQGRAPVKVTNENGIIHRGDFLTSSAKMPGYAMRATKAGRVIGIAMENFHANTSECSNTNASEYHTPGVRCTGKVMAFVNLSWYDPDVYLTSTGEFVINKVQTKTEVASATPNPQTGLYPSPNASSSATTTQPNPLYSILVYYTSNKPSGTDCQQQINPSDFGLVSTICPKNPIENFTYEVKDSIGNAIERVGVFSKIVVGTLKSGLVQTSELIADTVKINNKIISPIAEVQTVRTDTISPLSSNKIIVKLTPPQSEVGGKKVEVGTESARFEVQNASGSAVASIDDKGIIRGQSLEASSASISGTLDAFGLISKEASISGTLRTKNLVAENIDTAILNIKNQISKITTASPSATPIPITNNQLPITGVANIDTLNAQVGTFMAGLFAVGPTSLSDATVFGQLSVGGNLILADGSINVLGSDLKLQPLGQGGIFLGKKIAINANGDLEVNGDARFNGTLFANVISPIPNQDLVIRLSSRSPYGNTASDSAKFVVQNASGSAVLTVNSKGDLTASGSAKLNDLLAKSFSIVREAQADTSLNETVASSSAGFATITAGEVERTIITPFVKENSLIYLTPTSDTQGETPYIARQTLEDKTLGIKASFTIGISQPLDRDIKLNWWIVN